MRIFRDLYIRGSREKIHALMEVVEQSLDEGWRRNRSLEEAFRQYNVWKEPVYCFSCIQQGARPSATVFLVEKQPNLFYASNVTPKVTHQLSYDEYNAILDEFCERYVRPTAAKAGLTVELTSTQAELEQWLSQAAAAKLRFFAAEASKGTGSSRTEDRRCWNEFLLAAHAEKSSLDAPTLRRWLTEVENWPPEVADRLASEYEFSRDLLDFAAGRPSA